MKDDTNTIEAYLTSLPDERKESMKKVRQVILGNLPSGFEEFLSNGMISYVVPLSLYSKGYHVKPQTPLPFINLTSQKNHIALYHMGLYASPKLLDWFTVSFRDQVPTKLNMGKSCIRFTNPKSIPYALLGELIQKMTPQDWITVYEKAIGRA